MASHRAANQGYVYGTAARNMAAERERTRKQRVVQYRQDMSHTVRKNQEKALQMNLPYVIMLTLAAVCALYICIGYLHVQSSMAGYSTSSTARESRWISSMNSTSFSDRFVSSAARSPAFSMAGPEV